jgi:hypothetical protein
MTTPGRGLWGDDPSIAHHACDVIFQWVVVSNEIGPILLFDRDQPSVQKAGFVGIRVLSKQRKWEM